MYFIPNVLGHNVHFIVFPHTLQNRLYPSTGEVFISQGSLLRKMFHPVVSKNPFLEAGFSYQVF